MNTEELVKYLAETGNTAQDLLFDLNPKISRKFELACLNLAKIVDEIRQTYPDANIYVQEDQVNLMLGDTHTNLSGHYQRTNYNLVSLTSLDLLNKIDGGGW